MMILASSDKLIIIEDIEMVNCKWMGVFVTIITV
jgi:hypothetical protein